MDLSQLKWCGFAVLVALLVMPAYAGNGVAVIFPTINEATKEISAGFNEALSEKGISASKAEYNLKDKDAAAIASLIQAQKPEMIFSVGDEASKTAKSQLSSIPAVYTLVSKSADFDSESMTGVSIVMPASMRVELIKKVLPHVKKIGVAYSSLSETDFNDISGACSAAGLTVVGKKIDDSKDFVPGIQGLMAGQIDCFLIVFDPQLFYGQTVKVLLLESLKNKVPVIGLSGVFTKAGALMSPDCDYKDLGRQSGELAARIIKGEKPGAIKSSRPRKARYSLNMQTAGQMGITIAPSVVSGAFDVVQ